MAEMNPAALFPPQGVLGPGGDAFLGVGRAMEAQQQMELQTQMARQEQMRRQALAAEAERNLPLLEQQRQLSLQQGAGQLQRLPDVNRRLAGEAAAAAAPGRMASDFEGADLESQAKVRRGRIAQQADEMDTFAQAFEPIRKAQASGDFAGANEAWDGFFDTMEKHKMPGVQQMRLIPRDKLLQQLNPQYEQAMNTAPVLRERIKIEDKQAHEIELERMRQKGRIDAIRAKTEDEKDVNTPNAVIARLMKKMGDGETLSDVQKGIVKSHVETNFSRYEAEKQEQFKTEAAAEVRQEMEANRGWFGSEPDKAVVAEKRNAKYLQKRDAYLRRTWPQIYTERAVDFNDLKPRQ